MVPISLSITDTDGGSRGDRFERLHVKYGVVVPTLNAGKPWTAWIEALQAQTIRPEAVVVMDSTSDDNTRALALEAGFDVVQIERRAFDHGGTRQIGVEKLCGLVDVVVLLTQDAELADRHVIERILAAFADDKVGCAYGRQIPRPTHSAIAKHHRAFNYPIESSTASVLDVQRRGLRAAFCSNSFAAYRLEVLMRVGGFPHSSIFGEDMLAAIKLLNAGYLKRYVADAAVFHAHDYTIVEEFQRYFDMGVMHASEPLLQEALQLGASSSGSAFVLSELANVGGYNPLKCCALVMRSGCRLIGYELGKRHSVLPASLRQLCAMNKRYFR